MTGELIIVALIVGACALFLIRQIYRSLLAGDPGACGGACGCDAGGKTESEVLGRRIDLIQIGADSKDAR